MTTNLLENWAKIHTDIFGTSIPKHCEWTDIDDIITVLNTISSIQHSNNIFLPGGGDLELKNVSHGYEKGWIELEMTMQTWITKPKSLKFEFIDDTLERNYFRLETETIKPLGIKNINKNSCDELLCEIKPLEYIDQSYMQLGEYNGEELPESSRLIVRCFKGSFVIFEKTSLYNQIGNRISVPHVELNEIDFRTCIKNLN